MASQEGQRRWPAAWSQSQRHLQLDGNVVLYTGPGLQDSDAASVRADAPVPSSCGFYYFEVEVLDKGRDGFIGVGFSGPTVSPARLPGWEPYSFGYHGDDGCAFEGSGKGRPYGPTFTTGDVIGCSLDLAEGTIAYTKNGVELGVAFTGVRVPALYPVVGLRTPGESIRANFGGPAAPPFRADAGQLRREARWRAQRAAAAEPLPGGGTGGPPALCASLVLGYLRHSGHVRAAAALAAECGMGGVSPGGNAGLENHGLENAAQSAGRVAALAAVRGGDVAAAAAMAESLVPGLFTSRPELAFQLRTQEVIEMIRCGDPGGAIALGGAPLAGGAREADIPRAVLAGLHRSLAEASALLAYADPTSSPLGHVMSPTRREGVASALNAALLSARGLPPLSGLETLVRQAEAVRCELGDWRLGGAATEWG